MRIIINRGGEGSKDVKITESLNYFGHINNIYILGRHILVNGNILLI